MAPWNTDWTGIRNTDPNAKAFKGRAVTGAHAIWVERARIRNATVTDAYFLIAAPDSVGAIYRGKPRAIVECLWYGRKPPKTWMHLTLLGTYKEYSDYSGLVVSDFIAK